MNIILYDNCHQSLLLGSLNY